jgi:hypothetical protein
MARDGGRGVGGTQPTGEGVALIHVIDPMDGGRFWGEAIGRTGWIAHG